MKNLLLIYGGGGSEHKISQITASYIKSQIDQDTFNVIEVEMVEDGLWLHNGKKVFLNSDKILQGEKGEIAIVDLAIPCIHGYPGETGDIQSFFNLINIPFFGVDSEASKICFNKVLTKLWLQNISLPTADFIFLKSFNELDEKKANDFITKYEKVFIKASNQGSSVGCYFAEDKEKLKDSIHSAFKYSEYVLIEQFINARELEVSVFEFDGKIIATSPGEIICPTEFYDYKQKYDENSTTQIQIKASDIKDSTIDRMKDYAIEAFKSFNLKDLSRIDFFLTEEGEILINEINTFPGMTPISLFPQMMEAHGIKFKDYLNSRLKNLL